MQLRPYPCSAQLYLLSDELVSRACAGQRRIHETRYEKQYNTVSQVYDRK